MKNSKKVKTGSLALSFFVMLLLVSSCQKDGDWSKATAVNGKWIWEKSVGGFGGWTDTPESKKMTQALLIDNFVFKAFENDSLIFESAYHLETRQDTFWYTNEYIVFESGGQMAFKVSKDRLEMYEMCADCFFHTYKRE